MMYAETRSQCEAAKSRFAAEYRAKYPKAVESLAAHWERLTTFFDFPAEQWKHLRTTNVIESAFATVRLRERHQGSGIANQGVAHGFQNCSTWLSSAGGLDGAHLLPLIRAGVKFVDGVQKEDGMGMLFD